MKNKALLVLLTFVLLFQTVTSSLFLAGGASADQSDKEEETSVFSDVDIINEEGASPDPEPGQSEGVTVTVDWTTEEVDLHESYEESFQLPEEVESEEVTGDLTAVDAEGESVTVGTYQVTEVGLVTVTFEPQPSREDEDSDQHQEDEANDETTSGDSVTLSEEEVDQTEGAKSEDEEESNTSENGESPSEDPIEESEEKSGESVKDGEGVAETEAAESEEEAPVFAGSFSFDAVYTSLEREDEVENGDTNEEKAEGSEEQEEGDKEKENESLSTSEAGFSLMGSGHVITENIITNVTVKRDDVVLESGDELEIEPPFSNTSLELSYDFELMDGRDYTDGASYTITVPDMFTIPQIPESGAIDLTRADGTILGAFYTDGNDIIIVFNEKIEQESKITGNITLQADFDDDYDGPAEGDKIVIPFGDDESLEFPISFIPNENGLDKQAIGNRGYNTEFITWTVDVNKNLQTIEDAKLTDVLTQGDHTFIEDSFEIYELDMNADGSFNEPLNDVTESLLDNGFSLTLHENEDEFELDMGTIDSAYRIVYQTKVNDRTGEEYKNGATLTGEDDFELKTDATVAVTRGAPLAKEATDYDDVSQTIDWEVRYNYDEKVITQPEARLTDVFGDDNQSLKENSFEVYLVSIDPDTGDETGEELFSDYTLTLTDNGYTLEFDEDISDAFKIKYTTETKDRVEEDGNVTNEISDEFDNSAEGSQSIGQGILIKNNTSANYENKTTDWSVTLNRDEQLMQEAVFEDILPEGFTFDDSSFEISGYSGDYEIVYSEENDQVTVTFNNDITERVTVAYTTHIDYNSVDRDSEGRILSGYSNNASVDWIPEGEENSISKSGSATFNPDEYTKNNGFKFGSYNVAGKEITWTIGVNYNEEDLADVVVTDPILGNQNFDPDDVKVYKMIMTPGANDFDFGDEVTADVTVTGDADTFSVDFGDISTGYVIEFTTDLNNEQIQESYENTATVTSSNREDANLDATVSPRFGGEYSMKQGVQSAENGRIVNWTVNINFSQSEVENLIIQDTPSINQTILQDTVTIYETTATDSDISKDESATLTEGTDYSITFTEDEDGQESYEINFINDKETIDRAYVLEYDTYILYEGDGRIANDLSISGQQIAEDEGGSSFDQPINFNNISGSITGEVGALQIGKVDAENHDETLEGAVFHLYDETGEVLIRTGTTDENGALRFVNLLYGEYQLKEVTPPDEYALDPNADNPRTVEVNADSGTAGEADVTVQNYEIKRDVRLTKIDGTTEETLEGVEFELFQKDGTKVESFSKEDLTTDQDGEIYLEELAEGDYYFKEKTPQADYQENPSEYPFTIKEDHIILDIDADAITVENELIPGSGYMEKIDADHIDTDNNGLEGAEFRIGNQDPEIDFERTVTSGANGRIDTGDLRPGSYTIEEVSAPDGFELSGQDPIEFEIERSQEESIEICSEPFENHVKTTAIEVTKQDSINGQLLPGAEFELTYSEGDYFDSASSFTPVTGVTDENGVLRFEDLKPGTYELTETGAPEGYIADDTPIEVPVTLGDVHNEQTVGVTVDNDPFANITLTKVDSETETSLNGAVFALEDDAGNAIDGFDELVTDAEGKISITGLPAGNYQIREITAPDGYEIQDGGFLSEVLTVDGDADVTEELEIDDVGNDIVKGSVRVVKVDGESNERLENVEFTLNAVDLVNDGTYTETTHTTDSNGEIIVEDLRPGDYVFEEVSPLDGYQPHWGTIEFTIDFDPNDEVVEIEVKNYKYVELTAEKSWNDNNDTADERPNEADVQLEVQRKLAGEADSKFEAVSSDDYEQSVDKGENRWNYTFSELDAVDGNGEKYEYRIEEVDPGDNYELQGEVEQDGENDHHFTLTNVYTTLELKVEKVWQDDDDATGDRPDDISVGLKRTTDGTDWIEVDSASVASGDDWEYSFGNHPRYDTEENEYTYRVVENNVPDAYEVTDSGDQENGFTITNTRSGEVAIPVEKVWLDTAETADRSDVILELYRKLHGDDDNDYEHVEEEDLILSGDDSEDSWSGAFTDLPEFNDEGVKYTYQIREQEVDGYSSAVTPDEITETDTDVTVTNTRSNSIDVTVTKIWMDAGDPRRDDVTIQLKRKVSGEDDDQFTEVRDEKTISEVADEDEWTLTITGLEEFNDQGERYVYSVEETNVDEGRYDVSYLDLEITNTRSEKRTVEVTKEWDDDDYDQRPDDITVTLTADNAPVHEEVTIQEPWTHTFTDLERFNDQGETINYELTEVPMTGYVSDIVYENGTFTVTNTLAQVSVTVDKTWQDQNASSRPTDIEVQLYRNGEEYGDPETVSAPDWTYTFDELLKYDEDGESYDYTVEEIPVSGYRTDISDAVTDGDDNLTYEITNTRTGSRSVSGEKTWVDDEADDRPDSITVNLLRNGSVYRTQTVTEDDHWAYQFTGLPRFNSAGASYSYSIREQGVPGYVSDVNGFDLTNTRSETVEVHVAKSWLDEDETDRPDTITVMLYQNGDLYKDVTLSADDNWTHTFEDLDGFDEDGQGYVYTIEEDPVTGYETRIDGYDITNVRAEQMDIAGAKSWVDDEEEDRPSSIEVILLRNGEEHDSMAVTAEDDWTYAFEGVPAYDDEGLAYTYTISEGDVPGYAMSVSGYNLINTREPEDDTEDEESDDDPQEEENGEDPTDSDSSEDDSDTAGEGSPEDDSDGSDTGDGSEEADGSGVEGEEGSEEASGSTEGEEASKGSGGVLPDTATSLYAYLLGGILLFSAGIILLTVNRKRNRKA